MLKYQTWCAVVWLSALILYGLGLSSFNIQLCLPLVAFFTIIIFAAAFMAKTAKKVPLQTVEYTKEHKPIVTTVIALGFLADWAYQGTLPLFNPYTGFVTGESETQVTGIPVLHVVIIGCAIYWGMYLGYLFICNPKKRRYLLELLVILSLFVVNISRGYIVYIVFVPLLCFAAFHNRGMQKTKVSSMFGVILGGLLIIFFISVMGNMRYGYAWYDCSYIERIGHFSNYPWWLSKHFMWFYSYVTSTLANLNLNAMMPIDQLDVKGFLFGFLPSVFGYTSSAATTYYITSYFNATTGLTTFLRTGGFPGLYLAIVVIFVYYSAVRYVIRRHGALETFGNAVLCLLIVGFIFYNSLRTSALCYLPILLIIHSFYMRRKVAEGKVVVAPYEEGQSLGKERTLG